MRSRFWTPSPTSSRRVIQPLYIAPLARMRLSISGSVNTTSRSICVSFAQTRTYSQMPPVSRMRGVLRLRLNLPRLSITPSSNMVATMMIRPEPQIPLGRTLPIVIFMGSNVNGSMEKSSIAPLVARIPKVMPPPSNAGPAEQAAQAIQSLLPMTISALVPMSMNRVSSSVRYRPEPITPATISPPT